MGRCLDMNNFQSQIGIHNNIEYSWSNNIGELIAQYYFQLIRDANYYNIHRELNYLLHYFYKQKNNSGSIINKQLAMCYKLLIHTRDIKSGKGERDLSYLQLFIWYSYYPRLSEYALTSFVYIFGSWRDIKGICGFIRNYYYTEHPLIDYAVTLMVQQLKRDEDKIMNATHVSKGDISLAGRWAPRQKSKHNWLFNKMAYKYYAHFFRHGYKKTKLAKRKAKTYFRKLLSRLNRILQTPQVYMCNKEWSKINFDYMTSKTLNNIQKVLGKEHLNNDKTICKQYFNDYIQKHPKLPSIHYEYEMVQKAMCAQTDTDKMIVNEQWKKTTSTGFLNVIAMVDVSAYMSNENDIALLSAIGIGIRISENNSIFKDRLLLFAEYPVWVSLDKYKTFVDKVQYIMNTISLFKGTSCQFYFALQMILDKICHQNLTFCKNIPQIVILSHMQVERRVNSNLNTLFLEITKMYKSNVKTPHLIFWNLHSTNGFPAISNQINVTMVSGYSGTLIKTLFNNKYYGLEKSHNILEAILFHKRYDIFKSERMSDLNIN